MGILAEGSKRLKTKGCWGGDPTKPRGGGRGENSCSWRGGGRAGKGVYRVFFSSPSPQGRGFGWGSEKKRMGGGFLQKIPWVGEKRRGGGLGAFEWVGIARENQVDWEETPAGWQVGKGPTSLSS